MNQLFIILLYVLILLSCSSNTSTTNIQNPISSGYVCNNSSILKGSRQFGMDILDVSATGTYIDNLNYLKSLGGDFQTFHVNWNSIEGTGSGSTSGTFTDPSGGLSALNSIANTDGIKVTLRIHPVDVIGKFVPSDLVNTRFNHADMQTRFRSLLNFVFTKISPTNVTRLVVGNEIDGYDPGIDSNFWLDYPTFLFNLNAWLSTNYPTIEVGYVVTALKSTDSSFVLPQSGGLLAPDVFGESGWAGVVDFVGFTFYPLDTSFQVRPNSQVANAFASMVGLTTKPIHIEEVGFPSSTTNLGSETFQSEFICEIFKSWDNYSSRIPSLAILRMVDKTRADAESVATTYGLSGNENFIEYIRSLGIRDSNNNAKPAYLLLNSELQKRAF